MSYLDQKKLTDTLLEPYVTDEILKETDDFIESLATNFSIGKEEIQTPLTYRMERLATLYAYIAACKENAFTGAGGSYTDGNGNDAFSMKLKILKPEFEWLYDRITETNLTGEGPSGAKNIVISTGRA